MNRFVQICLLLFSAIISAQNSDMSLQNSYLSELLNSIEDNSFATFDTDQIDWRKETIKTITSDANIPKVNYTKTAMVLHMLKYKIGDKAFYKGIENYKSYISNENKTINLEDFKYYLEDVSGEELTYFFNDWFRGSGYPSYEVTWFQNKNSGDVHFSLKQIQDDAASIFYELPVPVEVQGKNGESQLVRLEVSDNDQNFTGHIPFEVIQITIDPEHHLISGDNIVKQGIDQEKLSATITLFPNPATSDFQIQNTSDAVLEKVSIYNMLGKLVLEKTDALTTTINLDPLALGVHLVKIETSQGTLHKTILKK